LASKHVFPHSKTILDSIYVVPPSHYVLDISSGIESDPRGNSPSQHWGRSQDNWAASIKLEMQIPQGKKWQHVTTNA